jgi:hypothetical protein
MALSRPPIALRRGRCHTTAEPPVEGIVSSFFGFQRSERPAFPHPIGHIPGESERTPATTRAPALASKRAKARPRPSPPPVTSAT